MDSDDNSSRCTSNGMMNGPAEPRTRSIPGSLRFSAATLALALLAASPRVFPADQVYKSVDAEGHVIFSDHPIEGAASKPYALEADDTLGPPAVIHFCWTNCFTLHMDNGTYRRDDGSNETWTIERFTSTSVILHRHDVAADWN